MLHNAARAYDPDTLVVDVEDLTMQILLEDGYHRRTPDLATSACGRLYHAQFTPVRREELRHPLSRDCGCFTAHELAIADKASREAG